MERKQMINEFFFKYGWSNADHMVLVLVAKLVDICVICIGAESI